MGVKPIVILKHNKRGTLEKFSFEHALALLRLQEKTGTSGWEISDKKWKFEKNEICRITSSRKSKESAE